jgi:hydrogenase maturation protease
MKTLILGAGNLLLSDEGFGVHFIRHLERHYTRAHAEVGRDVPSAPSEVTRTRPCQTPSAARGALGTARPTSRQYSFPPDVELFDAGTLGLMVGHKLEEADRVYIVDTIAAPGAPGTCIRYAKEDFLLERIPIKLSPHQVGVQEMLQVSMLRGRCPAEIYLLGVIPCSLEPGTELSSLLQQRLPEIAAQLVSELSVRNPPSRPWAAGSLGTRPGH